MSNPPFPPGSYALCPECGVRVTAWANDRELAEVYPRVEMWPGGPTVEATWEIPTMKVVNDRFTFEPCGHVLPAKGLSFDIITPASPKWSA